MASQWDYTINVISGKIYLLFRECAFKVHCLWSRYSLCQIEILQAYGVTEKTSVSFPGAELIFAYRKPFQTGTMKNYWRRKKWMCVMG